MTRIVIVGATGFTGRHVIVEALSRGLDVTALSPREGEDHTRISGEDMAKALVDQLTSTDDVGKMVNVAA